MVVRVEDHALGGPQGKHGAAHLRRRGASARFDAEAGGELVVGDRHGQIAEQAARLPADAPRFVQPDGRVKSSAAWLIDHAGFHKGFGDGPARLSTKHTLALTNRGGATAADVVALARTIRDGVRAAYGVSLVPEPNLVGVRL